ncbi:uncharacterized protein LOC135490322 [Lineus longissimus]|uniref:uncharacterized protein LOC135490322 n=1 Tax=Lineus longissimus TaxID=88925 RepID=UPI00315D12BA
MKGYFLLVGFMIAVVFEDTRGDHGTRARHLHQSTIHYPIDLLDSEGKPEQNQVRLGRDLTEAYPETDDQSRVHKRRDLLESIKDIFKQDSGSRLFKCPHVSCDSESQCNGHVSQHDDVCYCDEYCETFSDCCENYKSCTKENRNITVSYLQYMNCIKILEDIPHYLYVSSCPLGTSEYVKNKCENDHISSSLSLYERIPVMHERIPFQNVYCAQCHNVSLSETLVWRINACYNQSNDFLLNLRAVFSTIFDRIYCPVKPVESPNLLLRRCPSVFSRMAEQVPSIEVDGCGSKGSTTFRYISESSQDSESDDVVKCRHLSSPVFAYRNGTLFGFRNMYCARCSGMFSDLTCTDRFKNSLLEPSTTPQANGEYIDTVPVIASRGVGFEMIMKKMSKPKVYAFQCYSPPGKNYIYDPLTKSCTETRRCDMSHVEWNGTCLRDPLDQAYTSPTMGLDSYHLTVEVQLTLSKPLTLITTENNSTRNNFGDAFQYAFSVYFNLPLKEILNITVSFNKDSLVAVPLIGGTELTFKANTTFTVIFYKLRHSNDNSADMLNTLSFIKSNGNFRNVNVSVAGVYSRPVKLPLQCDMGVLVRLAVDDTLMSYLKHVHGALKDLQLVSETDSSGKVSIILCDLYAAKFKDCNVVNQNLSSFRQGNVTGGLVYLGTGEVLDTPYAIIGNQVYICIRSRMTVLYYSSKVQTALTTAGVSLSLLFLAMTLITHIVHRPLRTLPGLMLMNLCATLFVAQLLFITAVGHISHKLACQIMAMIIHYLWLATFFWMNAIALNLTMTFAGGTKSALSRNSRTKVLKYSAYAYGAPAVIVITCAFLDKLGNVPIGYGPGIDEEGVCWFTKEQGLIYAFILPVALLIGLNGILFIITIVAIVKAKKLGKKAKAGTCKGTKLEFVIYLKLSLLMGFTWIFGFVGTFTDNTVIWYLFIVFNTLQGVFIGVAFACNKRIFGMWRGVTTVTTSGASNSRSTSSTIRSSYV